MIFIDYPTLRDLIHKVTLAKFMDLLIARLQQDFIRWHEFHKSERHSIRYPHGVIELMPIADEVLYAMKYVNGHPKNPTVGKMAVTGLGLLSKVNDGIPILISEMTLLTAIRTACMAALVAKYAANKGSKQIGIIGTGAQSEFQILALARVFDIDNIYYYDMDAAAMDKFANNLSDFGKHLIKCSSVSEVVQASDCLVTTTTALFGKPIVFADWVKPGLHISAVGGDSPGKVEIAKDLLNKARIIVEYKPQTLIEGEIEALENTADIVEFWQIVNNKASARLTDSEITIFDSVGFAIEDYSALCLVYELANKYNVGKPIAMLPNLHDPKDLFGAFNN